MKDILAILLQLFIHFLLPAAAILLLGAMLRLVFADKLDMSKDLRDFLSFKSSTWFNVVDSGFPILRPFVWFYERVSGALEIKRVKPAPPVFCSSCGKNALLVRSDEGFALCLSCGKRHDF